MVEVLSVLWVPIAVGVLFFAMFSASQVVANKRIDILDTKIDVTAQKVDALAGTVDNIGRELHSLSEAVRGVQP